MLSQGSLGVESPGFEDVLAGLGQRGPVLVGQSRQGETVPGNRAGEGQVGLHASSDGLHPGDEHRGGGHSEHDAIGVQGAVDLVGDDDELSP